MNAPVPPVPPTEPHVMQTYGRLPIALSHGQGCWVWDTAGRRYLDGLGGIAVNTLGHAHPRLVPALQEQVAKLSDAEKKDKEAQFRTRIQDYQKRAQEFNQELQGKQKELVDDYMKRIGSATQTVAEKGGYSIVVDRGSEQTVKIVIYSKDTVDLTDQVIKEFDRVNK